MRNTRMRERYAPRGRNLLFALALLGGIAALQGQSAQAFSIKTGNSDLRVRWDNTLKYSAAFRVEDQDSEVEASSYNPNLDDGDRSFDRGLISNRVDILSEFDAIYKGFGVRLSGAAWYDTVYNTSNDNDSAATFNGASVDHDEFTDETRDLHGRKAEVLDAFAFGRVNLWENGRLSTRVGRYTLLYGESLFLGANGVAAAQAPIDIVKAVSVPNSQFKEIGMPVPQVSADLQIMPGLSLGGYYQWGWRRSRLPAAGSYFSVADLADEGAEQIIVGPGVALPRGSDIEARDSGQFGVKLKFQPSMSDFEYGLYAARYHEKAPVLYLRTDLGNYVLVYPENIWVYGASLSTVVGDANVSAEVSYRHHTPLAAIGGFVVTDSQADNDGDAAYPVGDTFHAQVSMIKLFNENFLWEGASLVGEVGYNRRIKVTDNEDQLDPNATRDAMGLRMVLEPEYFQVLPQLDLKVPIGLGYAPFGKSSLGPSVFGPEHGGDFSIGLTGLYRNTWKAGISFTHYFGPSGALVDRSGAYTYKQLWADRDFVSFSIQRTF